MACLRSGGSALKAPREHRPWRGRAQHGVPCRRFLSSRRGVAHSRDDDLPLSSIRLSASRRRHGPPRRPVWPLPGRRSSAPEPRCARRSRRSAMQWTPTGESPRPSASRESARRERRAEARCTRCSAPTTSSFTTTTRSTSPRRIRPRLRAHGFVASRVLGPRQRWIHGRRGRRLSSALAEFEALHGLSPEPPNWAPNGVGPRWRR